jgi:hypothetical protein
MEREDPLYHWKKHSGFKKGLLTDIVFGDEAIPHNDYQTTTNSQFQTKSQTDQQGFAGRSSGFAISDKGQKHIFFGDSSIASNKDSVTRNDFKETIVSGVNSIYSLTRKKKYSRDSCISYKTRK